MNGRDVRTGIKSRQRCARRSDPAGDLRAGDAASFETLVRTWCNQMLAVARRIVGNEEDAKDCVQEAFLNAFRKVTNFEGRSAFGTWLHRIVVNCAQ